MNKAQTMWMRASVALVAAAAEAMKHAARGGAGAKDKPAPPPLETLP
jgi:hypothetical protein